MSLLSGRVAPDSSIGVVGDYYLDGQAGNFYGPKQVGGWGAGTALKGSAGATGPTGTGATGPTGLGILNGAGTPNPSLGSIGSFYVNTGSHPWRIHGPKTSSGWGSGTSLGVNTSASRLLYKSTQNVTMGVGGIYGVGTFFVPDTGAVAIVPLFIYVTWGGTFVSETAVVQIITTFSDATTLTRTGDLTATTTGVVAETAPALGGLIKDGVYITGIEIQAQTTKATSTAVTCSAVVAGLNVN
jgi:hypothetical protein